MSKKWIWIIIAIVVVIIIIVVMYNRKNATDPMAGKPTPTKRLVATGKEWCCTRVDGNGDCIEQHIVNAGACKNNVLQA